MRRVIVTLDLTEDEARAVAGRIDGLGIHALGTTLQSALDETVTSHPTAPRVQIMLRTQGSNDLGGSSVEITKAAKADGTFDPD